MERPTGTPPTDGGANGPEPPPGGQSPHSERPHGDPLGTQDWTRRYEREPPPPRSALDPAALFVVLDALRRLVPRELEGQLNNLVREFLLTLRSLIDWYLERLDQPRREPRVEDIPID
ncbi:MAG TPA: hypothetical protein VHG69_04305 [Thermoleophilaceae bacterium]|nr:hypothetical protein [Thermoleophilaceae bacterium]